MSSSISLTADERNTLLDHYRADPDPALRLRAHIILLLAEGYSWSLITAVLFYSTQTVARWQKRFVQDRIAGLFGKTRGRPSRWALSWITLVLTWVLEKTPRTFGLLRSRWSCATVVLLLWQEHQVSVSRETVRRWLDRNDVVWRRPRPVIR